MSTTSQAPLRAVFDREVLSHVIHEGPGSLHSVLIGNAGCCRIRVRDGQRTLFQMPFAFAGSFYLQVGFNERLVLDMVGEMACHLQIVYRPGQVRHAA